MAKQEPNRDRHARAVALRIGPPPMPLEAIGEQMGITRERVRQILQVEVDPETRAKLDAAVYSRDTPRRKAITEARLERELSRMSMQRVNRRLREQHGEWWCSAGKHVVLFDSLCLIRGKPYSRCRACATKASVSLFKSRRDAGLCVWCGKRNAGRRRGTYSCCAKCRPTKKESNRKSVAKYNAKQRAANG